MGLRLTGLQLLHLSLSPPLYTDVTIDVGQSARSRPWTSDALENWVQAIIAGGFTIAGLILLDPRQLKYRLFTSRAIPACKRLPKHMVIGNSNNGFKEVLDLCRAGVCPKLEQVVCWLWHRA